MGDPMLGFLGTVIGYHKHSGRLRFHRRYRRGSIGSKSLFVYVAFFDTTARVSYCRSSAIFLHVPVEARGSKSLARSTSTHAFSAIS